MLLRSRLYSWVHDQQEGLGQFLPRICYRLAIHINYSTKRTRLRPLFSFSRDINHLPHEGWSSAKEFLYIMSFSTLSFYYYISWLQRWWCSFGSKERKTMQLVDALRESPTTTDEDVIYGVKALLVCPVISVQDLLKENRYVSRCQRCWSLRQENWCKWVTEMMV